MFNGERSGEAALKSHYVAVNATDGCGERSEASVKIASNGYTRQSCRLKINEQQYHLKVPQYSCNYKWLYMSTTLWAENSAHKRVES